MPVSLIPVYPCLQDAGPYGVIGGGLQALASASGHAPAAYAAGSDDRDGRRTEAQLRQWLMPVDPSSDLHEEPSSALFAFLAKHDRAPSTKMRISILKDTGEPGIDPNDVVVALMVAVARSLPPAHRDRLRARLAA